MLRTLLLVGIALVLLAGCSTTSGARTAPGSSFAAAAGCSETLTPVALPVVADEDLRVELMEGVISPDPATWTTPFHGQLLSDAALALLEAKARGGDLQVEEAERLRGITCRLLGEVEYDLARQRAELGKARRSLGMVAAGSAGAVLLLAILAVAGR